jgi:hypothetical protein
LRADEVVDDFAIEPFLSGHHSGGKLQMSEPVEVAGEWAADVAAYVVVPPPPPPAGMKVMGQSLI